MVNISFVPGRTQEVMDKAATATPRKRVVEADDVALAVMACITHLKDRPARVITVDAGRRHL